RGRKLRSTGTKARTRVPQGRGSIPRLQQQLEARTRQLAEAQRHADDARSQLAEARKHLSEALEQQTARRAGARFPRDAGFSVPKRAAVLSIISVSPMMALSGVRSSWLMLERNCDLFSLACCSCRLFSWISSNSRTFSIAITAWSAKVETSSICLSVNGRTSERDNHRTPMGTPSRNISTPSMVRDRPSVWALAHV